MKKTISIILIIISVLTLVSCNNTGDNKNNEYLEDAKKAFEEFYGVASGLEENQTVTQAFWWFDYSEFADHFVEITKKDRKAYTDLSYFDKFICYSTYIYPHMIKNDEKKSHFLASLEAWNTNVVRSYKDLLSKSGATDEAEAYSKLMEWQFNYHEKTGEFFDFLSLNLTKGKTE